MNLHLLMKVLYKIDELVTIHKKNIMVIEHDRKVITKIYSQEVIHNNELKYIA